MQTNYDTLKKKRKSRRFFTYVGVYFLLWLAFRSLIEIFRGGDISIASNLAQRQFFYQLESVSFYAAESMASVGQRCPVGNA